MLKQSPNRNQRTKGFKVIQGFKIFALIAVGIWLLYQLKHYYDKNKSYEESSSKIFEKLKVGHETNILGRKGFQLQPWINKAYELNDEIEEEESKPERVMERSSTGGGNDRDRVEEEEPDEEEGEDQIDEEDKEEEEEMEEDTMSEEEEEMEEDTMSLLEDQGHNEGEKDTHATAWKHYKETGASRVVML